VSRLLIPFVLLLFLADVNFAYSDDLGFIDDLCYHTLKKQFGHIIYEANHSLCVYWPEDIVRERVKDQVEWSLLNLGTSEAKKLLSQYQELDWNVQKMIDFHWSDPP